MPHATRYKRYTNETINWDDPEWDQPRRITGWDGGELVGHMSLRSMS